MAVYEMEEDRVLILTSVKGWKLAALSTDKIRFIKAYKEYY